MIRNTPKQKNQYNEQTQKQNPTPNSQKKTINPLMKMAPKHIRMKN